MKTGVAYSKPFSFFFQNSQYKNGDGAIEKKKKTVLTKYV